LGNVTFGWVKTQDKPLKLKLCPQIITKAKAQKNQIKEASLQDKVMAVAIADSPGF
jgi:hypothetical protein